MKNRYLSTRIMAIMMAAAMAVSAAPGGFAAERADSETIKRTISRQQMQTLIHRKMQTHRIQQMQIRQQTQKVQRQNIL
ncbi:MAG: hypothetical protein ACLUPF_11990 [Dorea sp.]